MKKLLIGLAIGATVAGIGLVIKHYRNNEEVEEIAIDVEVIDVEDIEIVDEELENDKIKLLDKIKRFVKAPIKLVVKMTGLLCGLLLKINKKLDHNVHRDSEYYKNEYVYKEGTIYRIIDGLDMTRLYTRRLVMIFNRCLMLVLTVISTMLNRLL